MRGKKFSMRVFRSAVIKVLEIFRRASIKVFTERRELCNFPQAGKAVNEDANLIRPEEISFTASLDK